MPVNDFRIDFNILKNYNSNFTQGGYNVDANPDTPGFDFAFGTDYVTYSKTAWTFNTAFTDGKTIYDNIVANAKIVSQRFQGFDKFDFAQIPNNVKYIFRICKPGY